MTAFGQSLRNQVSKTRHPPFLCNAGERCGHPRLRGAAASDDGCCLHWCCASAEFAGTRRVAIWNATALPPAHGARARRRDADGPVARRDGG